MRETEPLTEKLYGWAAIVSALFGIAVSIVDLVSQDFTSGPFRWLKGPPTLTLLLVSLISLGLGLERLTRYIRLNHKIKSIQDALELNTVEIKSFSKLLAARNSVRALVGEKQVYDEGVRLVGLAERNIRVTSIGEGPPAAPPELGQAYIDKLSKGISLGRPIRLDIVVGATSGNAVLPNRREVIERRYKLYQEHGVLSSVHFYLVPSVVGIDLLIVDNVHMIIGLSYRGGVEGFKYGLLFFNSPEVVDEFTDWFDNVLRENARPLKSLQELAALPE